MTVTEDDILIALGEDEETFEDLIATMVNQKTGCAAFSGFTFRLGLTLVEGASKTLLTLIGKDRVVCSGLTYRKVH